MAAIEDIEKLTTFVADCLDEVGRVWSMPYNPSEEKQIIYRYKAYCSQMDKLKKGTGDLIDFCKDLIENSPKVNYEFYRDKVFRNLNDIYEGKERITLWFRSCALLLMHYDELKIYEREEEEDICKYEYEDTGRGGGVATRKRFSDGIWWTDYGVIHHGSYQTLLEYCKIKDYYEYKLLSLLCHYKESKNGNVNIDYIRQLIVFAHTVCLYTVVYNEIKPLLKDAEYAGLNLEKLQGSTLAPQAKAKKKTKQPREVFTERAKTFFAKAEEAGYMEKVGDKYEWLYRGGVVALVYFFIRIYEPKSPPFKQLQPLFGVEGLTSSRRNLENTDWYKDEMKREAMTPEELARERRERKLKEPKEWFPELKSFFED